MQHRLKTQAKALESAFVTFSLQTKEDLSGVEDTIKQGAFTFLPHEIDLMNVTSFSCRGIKLIKTDLKLLITAEN